MSERSVSLGEIARVFLKIGAMSYGGVRVTFKYGIDFYFAYTQAGLSLQQNVTLPANQVPQIQQSSLTGVIGDVDFNVSKLYDMLPASTSGDPLKRTPADNQTVRNVFVIGPDKKIKLGLVYPMTTGRNFEEILRAIDSLQMTAKHRVATPADWKQGEDVIIAGSVSDDEAKTIYPKGLKAPKPYIRIVPQPR
jgi:hypothetical protein